MLDEGSELDRLTGLGLLMPLELVMEKKNVYFADQGYTDFTLKVT